MDGAAQLSRRLDGGAKNDVPYNGLLKTAKRSLEERRNKRAKNTISRYRYSSARISVLVGGICFEGVLPPHMPPICGGRYMYFYV